MSSDYIEFNFRNTLSRLTCSHFILVDLSSGQTVAGSLSAHREQRDFCASSDQTGGQRAHTLMLHVQTLDLGKHSRAHVFRCVWHRAGLQPQSSLSADSLYLRERWCSRSRCAWEVKIGLRATLHFYLQSFGKRNLNRLLERRKIWDAFHSLAVSRMH